MKYKNKLLKQNINENYQEYIEIRDKKFLKSTHKFIDTDDNEYDILFKKICEIIH